MQTLAFKLLQGGYPDLVYIDGFSGPWKSRLADFGDTSFMIAIAALKDAQEKLRAQGKPKQIRCFFVEENPTSYTQLKAAVSKHHDPKNGFHVYTSNGRFEDAIDAIMQVVGSSFALTFIDPTGWTGYEFTKIARILQHKPGEVLLNYMKSFIDRFTAQDEHKNVNFEGILGPHWPAQLAPSLPRDEAVEALFAKGFRDAGSFRYVLSTPIEKLEDRTAFCIVYGTRSDKGLAAYRDVEYLALKDHGMRRIQAKRTIQEERSGIHDLFAAAGIELDKAVIEDQLPEFCRQAREWLLQELQRQHGPIRFGDLWPRMLDNFTIRRTNVRTICTDLAKEGVIRASWKDGESRRRSPDDDDLIGFVQTD